MNRRRSVRYSTWWYYVSSSYLCDKDLMLFIGSSRYRLFDVCSHPSWLSRRYSRQSMHYPSTRLYAMLRLMRSFSSLFNLVPYFACSMAFVAAGFGPTRSGYAGSNTFPFRINVSTSPPPSSFVLRYSVVSRIHSENHPPSFPFLQSNLTCSAFSASLVPAKSSL